MIRVAVISKDPVQEKHWGGAAPTRSDLLSLIQSHMGSFAWAPGFVFLILLVCLEMLLGSTSTEASTGRAKLHRGYCQAVSTL